MDPRAIFLLLAIKIVVVGTFVVRSPQDGTNVAQAFQLLCRNLPDARHVASKSHRQTTCDSPGAPLSAICINGGEGRGEVALNSQGAFSHLSDQIISTKQQPCPRLPMCRFRPALHAVLLVVVHLPPLQTRVLSSAGSSKSSICCNASSCPSTSAAAICACSTVK